MAFESFAEFLEALTKEMALYPKEAELLKAVWDKVLLTPGGRISKQEQPREFLISCLRGILSGTGMKHWKGRIVIQIVAEGRRELCLIMREDPEAFAYATIIIATGDWLGENKYRQLNLLLLDDTARLQVLDWLRQEALPHLSERLSLVLLKRFGVGTGVRPTFKAVGSDLGVSGEQIRKNENQALKALSRLLEPAIRKWWVTG